MKRKLTEGEQFFRALMVRIKLKIIHIAKLYILKKFDGCGRVGFEVKEDGREKLI